MIGLSKNLEIYPSRQIEFARLNLSYMVMSKRKLLQLVREKYVRSWDDPRMPKQFQPLEGEDILLNRSGICKIGRCCA